MQGIFDMIYQTDFIDDPNFKHLQEAFDKETMPELFSILEDYKSHNDFLKLKNAFQALAKP